MKITCRLALVLISFLCASVLPAAELRISAPASLASSLQEVSRLFEEAHTDVTILASFASSGALARQIDHGAPADIYISAHPKWMDYLIKRGKIVTDSRKTLVYNSLVFVGRKKIAEISMNKLGSLQFIAIGSPASVPAGQYAEEAMNAAGIYSQLLAEGKLVMAKDVSQALVYADRGETDGAFVYSSDARLADHAALLFSVPQELYSRISYPMAITAAAEGRTDVRLFYDFLLSPASAEILDRQGFSAALWN